jgi:purine-binding chemotaxis protein CheW
VTEDVTGPDPTQMTDEVSAVATLPEWVVFSCAGEWFGVPLLSSREVVPPQPLTRLPGCGPEVAGLIGLRGRVVTAFDMGVVLEREASSRLPDHRILVIDHGDRVVAIAVDEIVGIAREHYALLQHPGAESLGKAEAVRGDVVGVGRLEGKNYFALDPDRILKRLLA